MAPLTRRALLLGSGAVLGGLAVRGVTGSVPVLDGVQLTSPVSGAAVMNDASLLSPTPINRHIVMKEDAGAALVDKVRAALAAARADGRPLSIGAARHSMGGQAIPPGGDAVTYDNAFLETNSTAQTYRSHPGARWSQVITALDPQGFSPKVMQSNNDFGVAATFSVNAHGWPAPLGPMGSTVRSVDMVLANGDLVTCSRTENTDLFGLAMGGYGLIGAIVGIEVEMAQNLRLDPTYQEMPVDEFGPRFAAAMQDPDLRMAYGRLNVDKSRFFADALMITYRPSDDQDDLPAASGSGFISKISRQIFRAQLGNERIKRARWWTETDLGPRIASGSVTRNSLLNEPVVTLDDRDPARTDILHEYFVPPERFAEFATACARIIPGSYQELLNVTLRYLAPDTDSVLVYAPGPRIAAVMLFSQEMSVRAEADMQRMTEELIDAATVVGGSYYLPYRPHARQDQLLAAYPRVSEFVAAKRRLDPGLTLRNAFWDRYLGAI